MDRINKRRLTEGQLIIQYRQQIAYYEQELKDCRAREAIMSAEIDRLIERNNTLQDSLYTLGSQLRALEEKTDTKRSLIRRKGEKKNEKMGRGRK